jgi:hypothetical protein
VGSSVPEAEIKDIGATITIVGGEIVYGSETGIAKSSLGVARQADHPSARRPRFPSCSLFVLQ